MTPAHSFWLVGSHFHCMNYYLVLTRLAMVQSGLGLGIFIRPKPAPQVQSKHPADPDPNLQVQT